MASKRKKAANADFKNLLEKLDRAEKTNEIVHEFYKTFEKYDDVLPKSVKERLQQMMDATSPDKAKMIATTAEAVHATNAGLGAGAIVGISVAVVAAIAAGAIATQTGTVHIVSNCPGIASQDITVPKFLGATVDATHAGYIEVMGQRIDTGSLQSATWNGDSILGRTYTPALQDENTLEISCRQ